MNSQGYVRNGWAVVSKNIGYQNFHSNGHKKCQTKDAAEAQQPGWYFFPGVKFGLLPHNEPKVKETPVKISNKNHGYDFKTEGRHQGSKSKNRVIKKQKCQGQVHNLLWFKQRLFVRASPGLNRKANQTSQWRNKKAASEDNSEQIEIGICDWVLQSHTLENWIDIVCQVEYDVNPVISLLELVKHEQGVSITQLCLVVTVDYDGILVFYLVCKIAAGTTDNRVNVDRVGWVWLVDL